MFLIRGLRGVLAGAILLLGAGLASASSAGFEVSAVEHKLGTAEEGEVVRYKLKVPVNQPLTLVATGMAYPRGGVPGPIEPEAGAWLFDDAACQLVPHEKARFDKNKVVVALKPLKAGTTKVRFVGVCLGYERKYEIVLEIVEK